MITYYAADYFQLTHLSDVGKTRGIGHLNYWKERVGT